MAGLWCTALGYSNAELVEAARAQMGRLPFTHLFSGRSHDPAIELAETLKELMPVPTSKIFFCSSGSEANDTQVKLAWYYNNALGRPNKKKIIARQKGYHGVTIARDDPARGAGDGRRLHRRAGDGRGRGDHPAEGLFPAIQAVLAKYDVRFIADEVICGFGRLGTWFGGETLEMRPDTISFAKAVTSGYVPLGGISIDPPLYEALLDQSEKLGGFGHGTTYSGHPVACAVAIKAIEIYKRDRVIEGAAEKAPRFQRRLSALAEHDIVGEAKGIGLIGGLEIVADKASRRQYDPKMGVAARCVAFAQEEGLIVRYLVGDRVAVCPPLIITPEEIDALRRDLRPPDPVQHGHDSRAGTARCVARDLRRPCPRCRPARVLRPHRVDPGWPDVPARHECRDAGSCPVADPDPSRRPGFLRPAPEPARLQRGDGAGHDRRAGGCDQLQRHVAILPPVPGAGDGFGDPRAAAGLGGVRSARRG
ncbi:hypothetical protein Lal_00041214 [Lupinus albus]|nr:hypothetical protein Lal_00041214 [Lupinus albus]